MRKSEDGAIFIEKNRKKFRMDIEEPGFRWENGKKVPEEPHFHFEEMNDKGKWVDTQGTEHRNYFEGRIKE